MSHASSRGGNVQKSPSSKAVALLTRGAYTLYVSTAKRRERRWRLFSTFPMWQLEGRQRFAQIRGDVAGLNFGYFSGSSILDLDNALA